MIRLFIFICFGVVGPKLKILAQDSQITPAEAVGFTEHLLLFGSFPATIAFVENQLSNPKLTAEARDSLFYFEANAREKCKEDSLAIITYLKVSEESPLYIRCRFLATRKFIDLGNFGEALKVAKSIPETDNENTNELKDYLVLGTSLILNNNNPANSTELANRIKSDNLKAEILRIKHLSEEKKKLKKRSPFLAGLLSALVPGLGKVYAGSNAQGLSTFVRVGVFAGLAAENFYRHGPKNLQFWFFSGLTSLYYVGGIYGSVYLPKLNHQERLDAINQNVKISLSVPF